MNEVIGRVGYIGAMAEVPISHPSCDPELDNLIWDWRDVPIRDARTLPGGATLRRHGFAAVPHRTAVSDWERGGWKEQFGLEACELIRQATGASKALVLGNGFSLRSTKFPVGGGPLPFCHNDFTAGSAPRHIAEDYPELAPAFLRKRFAVYNVWHLISPPPQSHPLALCDATSVAAADLVPGDAQAGEKGALFSFGENSMFRFNPAHRWYYFPDLSNEESLVWCGYDSDPLWPSIVPHSAFPDPNVGPQSERTNIHGSVYAFFD